MKRIVVVVAAASLALLGSGLASAPSAGAYGRAALWQIGLSFNCNNRSLCGSQLGGFWGWAEFDSDNSADAQLTDCEHMQGGRAAVRTTSRPTSTAGRSRPAARARPRSS